MQWLGTCIHTGYAAPSSSPVGTRVLFSKENQPGHEADHSLPYIAVVNSAWHYTPLPHLSSWYGDPLNIRDNFNNFKMMMNK
jgi:hypothetical protein